MVTKEKDMDRRRADDRWHFRKEIHAGHIITTGMIVVSVITAYFGLDKRIENEHIINEYQEKMLREHIDTFNKTMSSIQQDVREIRKVVVHKYNDK